MKKIIFLFLLFFFNNYSFSSDFSLFLRFSGALSENMIFSREFVIENFHNCLKFPFRYSFLFSQESFDNLLWGSTNRFSLKCNLLYGGQGMLFLKAGPGIGFATSYGAASFSPDIYLKLYFWQFFCFIDTSFYSDGLFNKNGIGISGSFFVLLILHFIQMDYLIKMGLVLILSYRKFYLI